MTFITHPDDATLQRLHEGGLTESEERATREHVAHCDACHAKSKRIATLFAVLATPPALAQPPVDFLSRVMANVERAGLVREHAPERRLRAAFAAVAAGGGVALAGGSMFLAGGGASGAGTTLGSLLGNLVAHGDLAATLLSAAAPVIGGSALATLAVLTPFFLKTMQTLQPRPATVRVTVR